jgi:enoyl-CoA hydratase/carnithine racemase
MEYETLKYEKEDGFVVITMNRPKSLNAMNKQFMKEFIHAHREILKDKEVNVWILTGAPRPDGRPCFSAGADLKEDMKGEKRYNFPEFGGPAYLEEDIMFPLNTVAGRLWTRRPRLYSPLFIDIAWSPKISIAAIDGIATAGGIEIALVCDIILVSETAQIGDSHVKNLKFAIGAGSVTTNLARKVGYSRALEICITGDFIDGKKAYEIGFANHVYPPEKLMDEAKALATKIASMRPAAIQMTKLSCKSVQDMGYNEAWAFSDEILRWGELDPEWLGLQGVTQEWDKRGRGEQR